MQGASENSSGWTLQRFKVGLCCRSPRMMPPSPQRRVPEKVRSELHEEYKANVVTCHKFHNRGDFWKHSIKFIHVGQAFWLYRKQPSASRPRSIRPTLGLVESRSGPMWGPLIGFPLFCDSLLQRSYFPGTHLRPGEGMREKADGTKWTKMHAYQSRQPGRVSRDDEGGCFQAMVFLNRSLIFHLALAGNRLELAQGVTVPLFAFLENQGDLDMSTLGRSLEDSLLIWKLRGITVSPLGMAALCRAADSVSSSSGLSWSL